MRAHALNVVGAQMRSQPVRRRVAALPAAMRERRHDMGNGINPVHELREEHRKLWLRRPPGSTQSNLDRCEPEGDPPTRKMGHTSDL